MPCSEIPVFVGVIGKRSFDADPEQNRRLVKIVQDRLDDLLDWIDQEVRGVSKVLITGGAAGADLISTRRILGLDGAKPREGWLTQIVLPFSLDLFREDFTDVAEWQQLTEVLDHPRAGELVRVTELPSLRSDLPAPDNIAAGKSPLSRTNGVPAWRDLRRRHYEQVGLWIADTANILIAVAPENDSSVKIGGTSRIVALRRSGRPDPVMREIIAASDVLAPRPELIRPPQQYVWLLDPAAQQPKRLPPVTIFAPTTPKAGHHTCDAGDRPREQLANSLAPVRMIQRLASAGGPDPSISYGWPSAVCPADVIEKIRVEQRLVRIGKQQLSRNTFTHLAAIFFCAVLIFEVFAKFAGDSGAMISVYVVLMASMLLLFVWAKRSGWQTDAEDFRALAELLRIQHAWWRAGLASRVDFFHLQGADQHLGPVREVARSAITWARLVAMNRDPRVDWRDVWTPSGETGTAPGWIGSQLRYFRENEHIRERAAKRTNALSWSFFTTSFCLALLLLLWLSSNGFRYLSGGIVRDTMLNGVVYGIAWALAGIILASLLFWLHVTALNELRGWQATVVRAAVVIMTSLSIGWSLRFFGEVMNISTYLHERVHDGPTAFRYLLIVTIVLLPAAAGALRFRAEKLAVEAEVLFYREALGWFEQADEILQDVANGDSGVLPSSERARAIVDQLGKLALAENESWLKARRERPLTPLI